MVPTSLVGYIETLDYGALKIIKELKQDRLEAVFGADVHQELITLSTGVIVLKKM